MFEPFIHLSVLAILAAATVTDLRARRIPNGLTLGGAAVGLIASSAAYGLDGTLASAAGWLVGFGLLLPLFLARGLGAGDVKLIAALGALKGPEFVFFTCLWSAVAGGLFALVGLLRSRRLKLALAHVYYCRVLPRPGDDSLISAGRLPYAPAIAVGAALVLGGVRWIG